MYLNKKKSDEQEEKRGLKSKKNKVAKSSDEGDASDLESQYSKKVAGHHQYSHSRELLVDKGEFS